MTPLLSLWLPIILITVACFIASSIIWMASPLHKHDYKDPGDKEGTILDMLKAAALAPGVYYVPWCGGGSKMKDPAVQERMKTGPWAMLTVMPAFPSMAKNLGAWAFHLLIVTLLVAYVTAAGRAPGAGFLDVLQVAFTAGLLAHAGYALPMCIWHGMPWSQLTGRLIDGAIYAAITGAIFAGMWPGVSAPGVG